MASAFFMSFEVCSSKASRWACNEATSCSSTATCSLEAGSRHRSLAAETKPKVPIPRSSTPRTIPTMLAIRTPRRSNQWREAGWSSAGAMACVSRHGLRW